MKCGNCKEQASNIEIINKSVRKYKMILCKKCFEKYNFADIKVSTNRPITN